MAIPQNRASSEPTGGVDRGIVGAMPFLALVISVLAFSPLALACGGGGSGTYRKPPRPDHQHNSTPLHSQAEPPATPATNPAKN